MKDESLPALADMGIESRTDLDHFLIDFKAILASTPFAGGLAVLLDEYAPDHTQKSMEKSVGFLIEHVSRLEKRIHLEAANRDEIAELLKTYYMISIRTHHDEKLNLAAGVFANVLLGDRDPGKLNYVELDHHMRCIEFLSIGALRILAHVVEISGKPTSQQVDGDPRHDRYRNMSMEEIRGQVPGMDHDLVSGLTSELDVMKLVNLITVPLAGGSGISFYLTHLGARFVSFLIDERVQH